MRIPRSNPGRRRAGRLLLAAPLLLLLATAAPVGAPPAAAAASSPGADSSAVAEVFAGVIEGSSEGAVTSLMSWGLSAIGADDADGGDFAEIEGELATISDQLADIDDELAQLEQELEQQTCDLETAESTLAARSFIDDLMVTYDDYLTSGATQAQLDDFVLQVLDGSDNGGTSLLDEVEAIDDALLDAGTAQGIIAACAAAVAPPTTGTMGDTDYYDQLTNLVTYFYGYQVKAALLLTEAYHQEAVEAAEDGGTVVAPTDVAEVCVGASGDAADYCNQAQFLVEQIYENIQDQFALSGAPYTTTDYSILNGTPYLWVLSLEDFTAAAGDTCTSPLSSTAPCGVTVGNQNMKTISVDYGEYDSWEVASVTALTDLLASFRSGSSDATPADAMGALGFSDVGDKIIVTPQTGTDDGGTLCFVDTSIEREHSTQPFCDSVSGSATTKSLLSSSVTKVSFDGGNSECYGYAQASWVPAMGWYDAFLADGSGTGACPDGQFITNPGWSFAGQETASKHQFHWPVLDVSAVTCTTNHDGSERSPTNPSGVYTMCGADFDAWLADIVPSPFTSTEAEVVIDDGSFHPRYLTVAAGTTVRWTNRDDRGRSVTADDASFDSSPSCPVACLAPGSTFAHTFAAGSTGAYFDRVAGGPGGVGTSGRVLVLGATPPPPPTEPSTAAVATDATPRFTG